MWHGRWYFTSFEDLTPVELQANRAYLNLAKLQYADQGYYTWYTSLYWTNTIYASCSVHMFAVHCSYSMFTVHMLT